MGSLVSMKSPARHRAARLLVGLLLGVAVVVLVTADAAGAASCSGSMTSSVRVVGGRQITGSTLEFTCDVNLGINPGKLVFRAEFARGGVDTIADSTGDFAPRDCTSDDGTTVTCTGAPLLANTKFSGSPRDADYGALCMPVTISAYGADPAQPVAVFKPTVSCGEVAQEVTLTVTRSGDGTGTVDSYYFSCPGVCSHTYTVGTTVALVATAASGSTFAGWSGGVCRGNDPRCQFTITADVTADARFTRTGGQQQTLHASLDSAVKVSGTLLSLTVGCRGPAGKSCAVLAILTATERLRSGKVIAVSSRGQPKTSKKVVTIAKRGLAIPAGASKNVTLSLNKTGRTLLTRFRTVPARLTVTMTNATKRTVLVSRTVTFKTKAPRRGR